MGKIDSVLVLGMAIVAAGCAGQGSETGDAPDLALDDGIETLQQVTYGSWTMTSNSPTNYPSQYSPNVKGTVTFTGSGSMKAGACLLNKVVDSSGNGVTCSTASDCSGYGGDHQYCAAPNNSGQKYCYVRPGPQSSWCAGTPATGSAITAGTYTIGANNVWDGPYYWTSGDFYKSRWVTYGCYAGCTGAGGAPTTPSVSSESVITTDMAQ